MIPPLISNVIIIARFLWSVSTRRFCSKSVISTVCEGKSTIKYYKIRKSISTRAKLRRSKKYHYYYWEREKYDWFTSAWKGVGRGMQWCVCKLMTREIKYSIWNMKLLRLPTLFIIANLLMWTILIGYFQPTIKCYNLESNYLIDVTKWWIVIKYARADHGLTCYWANFECTNRKEIKWVWVVIELIQVCTQYYYYGNWEWLCIYLQSLDFSYLLIILYWLWVVLQFLLDVHRMAFCTTQRKA